MKEHLTRKRLIAGAVAIAALAGGGAAVAATQLGPGADEQAIIDDAAERLGVEPAALSDALEEAYAERVDAAVAAGELTQAQGDALKERIQSGDFPLVGGPLHGERGPGHGGPFGGLDAAATYLGLTHDELRAGLESGKSLAELAADAGKTVDGIEQALLDSAKQHVAEAVAAGRLTEAQQQEILAGLPERIDDLVNREGLGPRERPRGGGFGPPPDQPQESSD